MSHPLQSTSNEPTDLSLSLEILKEGYVQSYVDFFYLTHRSKQPGGASEDEEPATPQELLLMKNTLVSAEQARRGGETSVLNESYRRLAEHFEGKKDAKTSIYFHEKCLEISRLTNDTLGQIKANYKLGLANQQLGNWQEATMYHEKQFSMATGNGLEEKRLAGRELINVYERRADELHTLGSMDNLNDAVVLHKKCLDTAEKIYDRDAQDNTLYRLSKAYVQMGDPNLAISVLNTYIESCTIQEKKKEEGAGYAVLSAAYIALGDSDNALQYLEKCLAIAEDTGDLKQQGEANRNLGVIYSTCGKHDKAVENFKKFYEISRANAASDPKTVNVARTLVGMANANAQMGLYINVLHHDLGGLLQWKNKRTPMVAQAVVSQ